jgi:hypothetical protein
VAVAPLLRIGDIFGHGVLLLVQLELLVALAQHHVAVQVRHRIPLKLEQ